MTSSNAGEVGEAREHVRRLAQHIVIRLRARCAGREWVADSLWDNIFGEVEREVEAALADPALSTHNAEGWRPIESAPAEGEFLAWVPMWSRVFQVRRADRFFGPTHVTEPTKGRVFAATHWLPLPATPIAAGQEDQKA